VFLVPKVTHELPLLSVLSRLAYDNEIGQMIASDPPGKAMKVRLGRWIMLCRELSISQQGKLLIPKDLCERAGLAAESDVMLVGRRDHFEIWSVENFDRAREIESRELQADDLGIL
jgi:MraZ protein